MFQIGEMRAAKHSILKTPLILLLLNLFFCILMKDAPYLCGFQGAISQEKDLQQNLNDL